ncbi:hypothetical protein NB640_00210 [Oxalobacter vibrioformis]|uniref:Ankyrin repeat domain-containing protein n=1 Tax=Oxalobacter vibrioformis TaxID=933080 RepID=A0A9E9M093_9BURK|nr:ankyrin repeat domain-containing protein [Oxalobacter vibrioformis]WAW10133.1 hypothetical protein NB640_00210 [Oxalobacter vibrioformis]
MKPFPRMRFIIALGGMLFALTGSLAFAQVSSVTVEDIARLVHERKMQELAKIPLKGFYLICAYGTRADVQKALKAGADPNAGDPEHGGTPPLTMAAGNNPDPAVVTLLLKAGADIRHRGENYNRTALHQVILFNKNALPVVKALLKGKPDLYVIDIQYNTALDYAIAGKTGKNKVFDGKPREDIMLPLLDAAASLPFTLADMDQKTFYTRKLRLYATAYRSGENGGKMNPKVLAGFKKAGADMDAVKPH